MHNKNYLQATILLFCKISSGQRECLYELYKNSLALNFTFQESRVGLTISRNKTLLSTLHCLTELTMPALVLTCSQIPRIKQHPSSRSPRLCCFTWNDIRIEMAKACFACVRTLGHAQCEEGRKVFECARNNRDSKIEIPEE